MKATNKTLLSVRVGTEKLARASELLKVAAHPQRLAILDLIGAKGSLCVSDLQERLGMEQAILSQHLILMRDKGLLDVSREGRYSYYRLKRPEFLKIIRNIEDCCDHL